MKIILYPAISLDGYIARSDGDSDWVTPEDERLFTEEVRKAGCVIVGNNTFKQYQGSIYPIQGAVTFVCSSSIESQIDSAVRYVGGKVADIIKQIASAGFTSAVLSGGADTNARFAEAGAITEMLVSIYPHVLGSGLKLFGDRSIKIALSLLTTQQLDSGVVQNKYKVLN